MRYNHFSMLPLCAFRVIGGRMTLEGGGKGDSPEAPDYSQMAAASEKSAELGYELGKEQLAENKRQYENNMKVAAPVVDAQLGLMKSQNEQGDEYYNYLKTTYRPIEQRLASDAENFSTDAAKEQYARSAASDVEQAHANESAQNARAMASMGVNPNSGKFQAIAKQSELTGAATRAGAMTAAREKADNISWAKRMDVAGLGKGLTGASQGAYGMALNSGNSAVANNAQAGNAMVAGMNAGTGTIMQGQGQALSGYGNILSTQGGIYNAQLHANAQESAGLGSLLGAGLGAAATIYKFSDRRVKENIRYVGDDSGSGLAVYEFNYIGKPNRRYRGVMADEVEKRYPYAVACDEEGVAKVNYDMIGVQMVEVPREGVRA